MSAEQKSPPTPPGIVNFTRVDATVACGGATTPEGFAAMAAEGFTSVVNFRLASEPGVAAEEAAVARAGLTYFHLPMDSKAPDPAVVERFLTIVADPANQPVYVHCASANRVGAAWAIKRVVQDGWPRERALEEAKAIGLKSPAMFDFVTQFLGARGSH